MGRCRSGFLTYSSTYRNIQKELIGINIQEVTNNFTFGFTRLSGYGHPRLVNILAKLYTDLYGHSIKPFEEVCVVSNKVSAGF